MTGPDVQDKPVLALSTVFKSITGENQDIEIVYNENCQ